MKGKIFRQTVLMAILLITLKSSYAQEEKKTDLAVKKGTFAIDAYYGFPNVLVEHIKSLDQSGNGPRRYQFSNIGPVGIRGEYFILDHIAMGVEANYSATHILWDEKYNYFDGNGYVAAIDHCDFYVSRLRILGKVNFHFSASKHFDWYAGGGLGINQTKTEFKSERPDYYSKPQDIGVFIWSPVAVRINFGGRFYFTKNIGIGLETGLFGGPVFASSLCVKF